MLSLLIQVLVYVIVDTEVTSMRNHEKNVIVCSQEYVASSDVIIFNLFLY